MEILGWIVGGGLWLALVLIAILGVPPVPSRRQEMKVALELAQLKPGEVVFDLGAGDGRMLAMASRLYGVKTRGWEIHPVVWLLAYLRFRGRLSISLANMWSAPVEQADVVITFLMPKLMARVERDIWAKMKPGSRLVSNAFPLPTVRPNKSEGGVYLYIKY